MRNDGDNTRATRLITSTNTKEFVLTSKKFMRPLCVWWKWVCGCLLPVIRSLLRGRDGCGGRRRGGGRGGQAPYAAYGRPRGDGSSNIAYHGLYCRCSHSMV